MTVKELIEELKKHKENEEVKFTVDLPDSSESECDLVGVYSTVRTTYKNGELYRKRFYTTLSLIDKRATE